MPLPLRPLAQASSPLGEQLVDPEPHFTASPHQRFQQTYTEADKSGGAKKSRALAGLGLSKKIVFRDIAGEPAGTRYIAKPYFERPPRAVEDAFRAPIGGWAEMTSQGLYHAAGIGHLHQQVIAAPSEHGPVLVIRVDPVHQRANKLSTWSDDEGRWVLPSTDDEHHRASARKIATVDWLSNNWDRNGENLLLPGPLAIDHGAAFQYLINGNVRQGDDYFEHYAANPERSVHDIDPHTVSHFAGKQALHEAYGPVLEWWRGVSDPVKREFSKHLQQVRDPKLKDALQRNFGARAAWLDRMADGGHRDLGHNWHEEGVALY